MDWIEESSIKRNDNMDWTEESSIKKNDNMDWTEEPKTQPSGSKKRKRKVGKRIIVFNGWGSTTLLAFLEAIGKDVTIKYTQRDVATMVTKYVNDKSLACPTRKKKILCDEVLYNLYGKKTIFRTKIFDLLEEHFDENYGSSDEEELDSSDDEHSKRKNSYTTPLVVKKVPPKSCYAAVIAENIKVAYLKKTLIEEFLKVPETFNDKVIGSFVRMRSDRYDIYQKNRFNLQLVTGVEKPTEAGGDVRLKLANYFKDLPASELSDDNFTKEEIKDLQDRIKAGSLRKLTVAELEVKAKLLHADITGHGVPKELILLKHRIDHANEKGRRKELFEYLERRKLLERPSEVEKMKLEIPEVIAEELEEPEVVEEDDKAEGGDFSPISILRGNSDISNASGNGELVTPCNAITNDSHAVKEQNEDQPEDLTWKVIDEPEDLTWKVIDDCNKETQAVNTEEKRTRRVKQEKPLITTQVIELSDDDDDDDEDDNDDEGDEAGGNDEEAENQTYTGQTCMDVENPDDLIWYYMDPQGITRGPFTLYSLQKWDNAKYFPPGFKVWKKGQSHHDSVSLVNILNRFLN